MRPIALLCLFLALAGCGKKGALYLPDAPPSNQTTSSPTP